MSDQPLSQEEIDKLLQAVISKENEKATLSDEPIAAKGSEGAQPSRNSGRTDQPMIETKTPRGVLRNKADAQRGKWGAIVELQLHFTAEIGTASLKLGDVLQLGVGSRLPVKTRWMEPLVLRLNGKTVGYGRVVLVGNKFGVEVTSWGRLG